MTAEMPVRAGSAVRNADAAVAAQDDPSIGFSPALLKNQSLLLQRVRLARGLGELESGRRLLESALRADGWKSSKIWWELVSLVSSPRDYRHVRALWLSSPDACHRNVSILRAVARAAVVTGYHDDARTLLRKLIVLADKRRVSAPSRVDSGKADGDGGDFANRALEALVDLDRAFSDVGLKFFLISGTLLGKIRDDGIIGWDKDIDVGYFVEECSVDLERHFVGNGKFRIGRVDLTSERLRVIHENGMWIDVFPHYMEGGRRWHDGTATRWWNTPFGLDTTDFLGIDQYIPDNPELYLDENYGDWRKPNPFFDARIDAPNAEVTDPEHFVSLLYFGLEASIRGGKDVMSRRYIDLLRNQGEGEWLDRIRV